MKASRSLPIFAVTSILIICCTVTKRAAAFYPEEHWRLTLFAFDILKEMYPAEFERCQALKGEDSFIRNMRYENVSYVPAKPVPGADLVDQIAWEAVAPDCYRDLEFVDVDFRKDDPHSYTFLENKDEATYSTKGDPLVGTLYELFGIVHNNFTAFNHFINIGSYGKSKFDDYDGYSYEFIQEYGRQYQTDGKLLGKLIDDAIMWYYNDEYVHAPGQPWYIYCSPSVARYSFPSKYETKAEELTARFPVAKWVGGEHYGIPNSVFTPVDNMARFWYDRFLEIKDPLDLGPVMHAIGDASIPNHTAGYLGNWHQYYESEVAEEVLTVINSASARSNILALIRSWDRMDRDVPESLAPDDYAKTPAGNWSIDNLVTWVALNAYRQYKNNYEPYFESRGEKVMYHEKASELVKLTVAMNVLVLKNALTNE